MATVTGLTADRMLAIEAASIVDGEVDSSGNLILTKHDGTEIDAGHVKGADATALMTVVDTASVDLTLAGSGTPASPWEISATVIRQNAEKTSQVLTSRVSGTNSWMTKGGDGVTYGPFNVSKAYLPIPGDTVWLTRNSFGNLVIGGAENEWMPLMIANASVYNAVNADFSFTVPEFKVRHGFVALRGLVAMTTVGSGVILATLPVGARPDTTIVVPVNNTAVVRALYIQTGGRLVLGSGTTAGGYYSLDGIVFPVAGKATWTYVGDPGSGLTFANGWTHYQNGTGEFGKVGFWKDEYGFIWTTGLITAGATAPNTNLVNITNPDFLPWSGTSPSLSGEQHILTVSSEVIGGLNVYGSASNNAIRCGAGIANGSAWMSLFGVSYLTNACYNHPDWIEHPRDRGVLSSWIRYGIGYPTFAYRQRPDGMVVTKGFVNGGAVPSVIDFVPESYLTDRTMIFSSISNGAYARTDLTGSKVKGDAASGKLMLRQGSTTWFSLDMLRWYPE